MTTVAAIGDRTQECSRDALDSVPASSGVCDTLSDDPSPGPTVGMDSAECRESSAEIREPHLNQHPLLTVIVPIYNEARSLQEILSRVSQVACSKQVIVVDDCSTDGSAAELLRLKETMELTLMFHDRNRGKGAAIRTALTQASGQFTVIQDGDLEYDPNDYPSLLAPLVSGAADVVYGSRYLSPAYRGKGRRHFDAAVKLLNITVRLLYGATITDEATCYKVFRTETLKGMDLACDRFEFCPEVTAKACRLQLRIAEVPIRYSPRSVEEGKKIRLRDAWQALATLWKYRTWAPSGSHSGQFTSLTQGSVWPSRLFVTLAALLYVASGLKVQQSMHQLLVGTERLSAIGMICLQLVFGTWLIAGPPTFRKAVAAIGMFGAFAVVAGWKALSGETSCGCFGELRVHPWLTFGLDVGAVGALVHISRQTKRQGGATRAHRGIWGAVAAVMCILATSVVTYGQSRIDTFHPGKSLQGRLVLLEPEAWLEQPWPLLAATNVPADLSTGDWDVLLFRSDCETCHSVLDQLEAAVSQRRPSRQIALVSIDGTGPDVHRRWRSLGCSVGSLAEDREWLATTPLLVQLENGICTSARVIGRWEAAAAGHP